MKDERDVRRQLKALGFRLRVVGFNPSEWKLTDMLRDAYGYPDHRSAAYFAYPGTAAGDILAAARMKREGKPSGNVWLNSR